MMKERLYQMLYEIIVNAFSAVGPIQLPMHTGGSIDDMNYPTDTTDQMEEVPAIHHHTTHSCTLLYQ